LSTKKEYIDCGLTSVETICPKRNPSRPHPGHRIYPYLVRDNVIKEVKQM